MKENVSGCFFWTQCTFSSVYDLRKCHRSLYSQSRGIWSSPSTLSPSWWSPCYCLTTGLLRIYPAFEPSTMPACRLTWCGGRQRRCCWLTEYHQHQQLTICTCTFHRLLISLVSLHSTELNSSPAVSVQSRRHRLMIGFRYEFMTCDRTFSNKCKLHTYI